MESIADIKRTMFEGQMEETERTVASANCIMIIDDNLDIIDTFRSLLRPHYRLISCLSFEEAKRSLTREVKVVLLDIKMAGKDGLEVFKLLRDDHPELRIIFHSAYPGSSKNAAAVERLDHSGYLTKGEYDLPELLAIIQRAIEQPVDVNCFSSKDLSVKKEGRQPKWN